MSSARGTHMTGRDDARGSAGWAGPKAGRAAPQAGTHHRSRLAVWTVPNAVSALRLLGVPVFLWLVLGPKADVLALVVLMVSGFTDWLDGYLARRMNQTSKLGEILDPVADRLYILA